MDEAPKYSVQKLASICGVSETAIKKKCEKLDVAKVAKQWQPTEQQAHEIIRYYLGEGAEVAEHTKPSQSKVAEVSEHSQDDKTAGQTAILEVKLEQMEKRLQEQKESMRETIDSQKEEIIFLRSQVNSLTEKNERLQLENDGMKNQMLLKAAESQESNDEVINIPFQEEIEVNADIQEKEEIETNAATPEDIQEQTNVMEDFKKQLRGMSIFDFWKFRKTL